MPALTIHTQRWLFKGAALLISTGILLAVCLATGVYAQLNENCTVSILNRTAQVKPDGTWIAINVPANFDQVRARATCVENGVTRSGQSDLFSIPAIGSITLGDAPVAIAIADINGDDTRDVITANLASNDATILLGNGDGTFRAPAHFAVGKKPQAVIVAYVNRDGIPDLLTVNAESNDMSVLIGDRKETFQPAVAVPVGDHPVAMTAGNLSQSVIKI